MLTIRNDQLYALEEARRQTFSDLLLAMLRHESALEGRATTELAPGYLEALVDRGIAACRKHGYRQHGTIADVVQALWRGDEHPLDPAQMARKIDAVMTEQHTRVLFVQARAVEAAMQRTGAVASQG
ncbi:MAG: hypothetical protein Q8N44_12700 [Rubrivivax sp.]|nr:hypothetical protein [Rubrivivax sp.]